MVTASDCENLKQLFFTVNLLKFKNCETLIVSKLDTLCRKRLTQITKILITLIRLLVHKPSVDWNGKFSLSVKWQVSKRPKQGSQSIEGLWSDDRVFIIEAYVYEKSL